MGPTPGAPARPGPAPAFPFFEQSRVEGEHACSQRGCRNRTRCMVIVARDPAAVAPPAVRSLPVCGACRIAGDGPAPPAASGLAAGPWVQLWLRRAGLIPFLDPEAPP